jgi:hypothetical protein
VRVETQLSEITRAIFLAITHLQGPFQRHKPQPALHRKQAIEIFAVVSDLSRVDDYNRLI